MAQRTVSLRKDLIPAEAGRNKLANTRLKSILDHTCGLYVIAVADGSTVLTGPTLSSAFVVTDVHAIKTGATGGSTDAVQLCSDSALSNAVSSSLALDTVAADTMVRTTAVTAANASFASGAKMYVKRTHTTDCACSLVVRGYFA